MAEKKSAKKAIPKKVAKRTAKAASASTTAPKSRGTGGKKTAAAKSAAKQPPAKKAPAKKAPAKKAPAKKAPAKKTTKKTTKQASAVRKATEQQMPEQLAERASVLAVREDESPWSPDELNEVLADLRADADRLRGEILDVETELDDMLHNSGEGAGDDQADAGSKTFEREHEMSLVANARDMLAQTERAIHRIEAGTYGNCEGCDRAIGKERLRAYPRATLCVSCKQREERR